MEKRESETYWARIYMAGDINIAKQVCRKFCVMSGLCVNIQQVDYIYSGGEEIGFCVELINYPRFPMLVSDILQTSNELANTLMFECCQASYSIMTSDKTYWYSRKESFR